MVAEELHPLDGRITDAIEESLVLEDYGEGVDDGSAMQSGAEREAGGMLSGPTVRSTCLSVLDRRLIKAPP